MDGPPPNPNDYVVYIGNVTDETDTDYFFVATNRGIQFWVPKAVCIWDSSALRLWIQDTYVPPS